jgi:pyridoxamine 5'-phosphate oxidase
MKLHSIRKEYRYAVLDEHSILKDPLKQFATWLNEALKSEVKEATAMSVSTIGEDGFPQSRIVLLKDYNETGFTFFSNYNSSKGKSIAKNPAVSLHFFWPELERQIRITGLAKKTSDEISDQYFESRPVNSQIAAIISNQSDKIKSRAFLQEGFEAEISKWENKKIQRPKNWGGYLVQPVKYEFWQGRENRLHDRILFEKEAENWKISRLAP